MKKILLLLAILFISVTNEIYGGNNTPPRFAVLSDIHFGNSVGIGPMQKVPRALKNLTGKGELDAIFVVGDLTDSGTAAQYDQLLSVFNNQANVPSGIAVYYLMGNHDNFIGTHAVYQSKLGQPLNQYVEIKDYPFITLSQNGTSAEDYNQAAKNFLTEKLAYAAAKFPGKPIFVFVHVPPKNTCYGSSQSEGWGSNAFVSILNQYPQAVVFAGHSHFPLGDPRSIHQDKFTSINDGSSTYSEVESGAVNAGIHPEGYENVTEGLIVNVLDNGNVELERWDTYRNEEILPKWSLAAPHDGTRFAYKGRNGLPAPVFDAGSKPVVTMVDDETYTVKFPQAADNDAVHRYLVEITENGQSVSSFKKFSQFYLNSQMPPELSVNFTLSYPEGKTLVAQVKAIDSYNNTSAAIQEAFTITPYIVNPDVQLPKANLMDLSFDENGSVSDISPMQNPVAKGNNAPQIYKNMTFNRTAARFTGNNQCFYRLDYKNNAAIKAAFANGFSFETLYMPNSTANMCPLSAQELGGAGIEQSGGGVIQFWIQVGLVYKILNSVTVTPRRYYHVVATYNKAAGTASIYVDGVKAAEQTMSGSFGFPLTDAAHWIAIGGDASSGANAQFPLNGEIVIARMYDKALSRDEITLLYADRIVSGGTGIRDLSAEGKVYGKNTVLHIEGFPAGALVKVHSLQGVKIAADKTETDNATIQLPAKGIYIVEVQTAGKEIIKKVVVN